MDREQMRNQIIDIKTAFGVSFQDAKKIAIEIHGKNVGKYRTIVKYYDKTTGIESLEHNKDYCTIAYNMYMILSCCRYSDISAFSISDMEILRGI